MQIRCAPLRPRNFGIRPPAMLLSNKAIISAYRLRGFYCRTNVSAGRSKRGTILTCP
jgi:hypothetical protein